MNRQQIATIVNEICEEALGKEAILAEDLTNVVDVGKEILGALDVDTFTQKLWNKVGKVWFDERKYKGRGISIFRDAWEFGSALQKVRGDMPDATINESWRLQNGVSVDPNVVHIPDVEAKIYNNRVTFEIDITIPEQQVNESFNSAYELNKFFSMLYNLVDRKFTLATEQLIARTFNYAVADTFYKSYNKQKTDDFSGATSTRAVNLLKLYNDTLPDDATPLTADVALITPEFLRFAAFTLNKYAKRFSDFTTLFNNRGVETFTPEDMRRIHYLADFSAAANVYLQSDTFHNELTKYPEAVETWSFWQGVSDGGSHPDYDFANVSAIDCFINDGDNPVEIKISGLVAVMTDYETVAVTNEKRRTPVNYNGKGEFTNYFHKMDAAYMYDDWNNLVAFYIA